MSVSSSATTPHGEPVVDLVFEDQSARVALLGATVISWRTSDGCERLWMSSLSARDGERPIRGGIPIAFPQFADEGALPLHGYARVSKWSLASHAVTREGVSATFALDPLLKYTVLLGSSRLRVELEVSSSSSSSDIKEFTACFHTYFKVDSRSARLVGLKGLQYYDKVADCHAIEEDDELSVEKASRASGIKLGGDPGGGGCEEGFVDRIYKCGGQRSLVLKTDGGDVGSSETYTIKQTGFPDTVVFNPWIAGKKGDRGPDFDDDGYEHMLCVEPAISRNGSGPVAMPVVAGGGEKTAAWKGSQDITIESS